MIEVIATGKTVDAAKEEGYRQLGKSLDDYNVHYEILDMGKKRLFGSIPAKVRVYYEEEEEFSVKDLFRAEEKKTEKPAKEQPSPEKKTDEQKKNDRPKKQDKPVEQKKAEPKTVEKKPEPKAAEPVEPADAEVEAESVTAVPEVEIALDKLPEAAAAAFDYLKMIADGLGAARLEYKAFETENGVKFVIDGDDAAILIGRRGETMDALQYLCLLVSNRTGKDYCKISIDVANYRSKREKTLEELAKKIAAKVKKTHHSQTLEPMNPYERRIVHSTIQKIDGVKSESVGEDPNRRVVISLVGSRRYNDDRRSGGNRYNNSGRGGNRNPRGGYARSGGTKPSAERTEAAGSTASSEKPAEKPAENPAGNDSEKLLYQKIEF